MNATATYEFDSLGLAVAPGVYVEAFDGTADIGMDNGDIRVMSLTLKATRRVVRVPGGARWPEPAKFSIAYDETDTFLRSLFEKLAWELETNHRDEIEAAYFRTFDPPARRFTGSRSMNAGRA